MLDVSARALAAGMLGLLMVGITTAPMAQATDGTICRVCNVTRGTTDASFRAAIRATRVVRSLFDASSSVTGDTPDDCFGTTSC